MIRSANILNTNSAVCYATFNKRRKKMMTESKRGRIFSLGSYQFDPYL